MTQQEFKFVSDRKWVLLLRASIRHALLIKNLGASCFALYVLIHSESDIDTGGAILSFPTIRKLTGFSTSTISASLQKLIEAGLIESEEVNGRGLKKYYCKDVVPFAAVPPGENPYLLTQRIENPETSSEVEYSGQAEFRHVPRQMTVNRKEILDFLTTGEEPKYNVEIKHFTLNIHFNNVEAVSEQIEDAEIRSALLRMASIAKERAVSMEGVRVIPVKKKKTPGKG